MGGLLQNVISLIKRGDEERQAEFNRTQEFGRKKAADQSEADFRKGEIDARLKELKLQENRDKIAAEAAGLVHKINQHNLQSSTVKEIQSGIPQAGDIQQPVAQSPQGADYTPIDPSKATSFIHEVPGILPPTQIDTEKTAATKSADLARISLAPGEEVKTREAAALQQAETLRQLAVGGQKFANDKVLQTVKDTAANERAKIAAKARVDAANIAHTNNLPDFDAETWLNGIATGQFSQEYIKRSLPPKLSAQVLNMATSAGYPAMTDKEKALVGQFEIGVKALQAMHQFNKEFESNYLAAKVPGSETHSQMQQKANQIKESLIGISTVLNQASRMSDPRIKALSDSFTPEIYSYTSTNKTKEKQFANILHDVLTSKEFGLSPQRAALISDSIGLADMMKVVNNDNETNKTNAPPARKPLSELRKGN